MIRVSTIVIEELGGDPQLPEDSLLAVFTYSMSETEIKDQQEFFGRLSTGLGEHFGGKVMTLAEELRQEGMQAGIQKQNHILAKRFLRRGIDPRIIAEDTGLSLEEIQHLDLNEN